MKTWFITGASSGFGKELAIFAAKQGDKVYATARNPDKIKDLASDNIFLLELDVTDINSIKQAVSKAKDVDILVNNAGIGGVGAIEEMTVDQAKKIFDVNLWGIIRVTQALLPHFREQKSGHIINISSVAGLFSMPGFGIYCASKHAVEAITDALGGELAEYNVHVTAVEPGAFATSFAGSNIVDTEETESYKNSAGGTREFLKAFEGGQAPGDPVKAVEHIYKMTQLTDIPRRLPLGEDAWEWVGARADELKSQLLANENLTRGTDK